MKTPEEIKKALEICRSDDNGCVKSCPYAGGIPEKLCMQCMANDALTYIEQLEESIDMMMIQMHGDCGCCKNFGPVIFKSETEPLTKDCFPAVCRECMDDDERPNWEYEGLPELPTEGESA